MRYQILEKMRSEPRSDRSVCFECVCCGLGIECSDDEALDDGQDEEVSRWEQEQIRKGISIPQVSQSTRVVTITTF